MSKIISIIDEVITQQREEEYGPDSKKKTSFWASESELMAFEIYHRWIGTKPTNPMDSEKRMMLNMRKMTEKAIVALLRESGRVIEEYSNDERAYFEWGQHKTPISGYPDTGIYFEEIGEKEPQKAIVEIKTYYGGFQHTQISGGTIKSSYLKQLAIYMHYFKERRGILLMINQGTGEMFEFELFQHEDNPLHFICDNGDEINLEDTFKRFEKIYVENILTNKEPEIEFQYKYDIKKVDWTEVTKANITKARTNKAVLGDWQCKYSDFLDIIIERQKTTRGYTKEELAYIQDQTKGYTTKKANQVRFDPNDL